jgi:hypothetical protein
MFPQQDNSRQVSQGRLAAEDLLADLDDIRYKLVGHWLQYIDEYNAWSDHANASIQALRDKGHDEGAATLYEVLLQQGIVSHPGRFNTTDADGWGRGGREAWDFVGIHPGTKMRNSVDPNPDNNVMNEPHLASDNNDPVAPVTSNDGEGASSKDESTSLSTMTTTPGRVSALPRSTNARNSTRSSPSSTATATKVTVKETGRNGQSSRRTHF